LDRGERPIDTAELAGFLIGRMPARALAEGAAGRAYRGITPRK
jgi:hypothetical protein